MFGFSKNYASTRLCDRSHGVTHETIVSRTFHFHEFTAIM
jgi:hypothetical protein